MHNCRSVLPFCRAEPVKFRLSVTKYNHMRGKYVYNRADKTTDKFRRDMEIL